jgi:methionine aminopeptidase
MLAGRSATLGQEDLDDIDKAVNLSADAHEVVLALIKQMYGKTVTVGDLRTAFHNHIRTNGGEQAMCYSTLIAVGADSVLPHGNSADSKVLKESEQVMWIDAGGKVNGKCSDITRTYLFGSPTQEVVEVYQTVHEAQNRSIALLKPGAIGRDIHNAAANYIQSKGHSLPHCLGHSFNNVVHEAPYSCSTSSDVMQVGDTQTIEPGIYLNGKWGMRIEDDYRVVPGGAYYMHRDRPKTNLSDIIIKPQANVSRIEVAPATATITADQTQQFTATGYDAGGNPVAITAQWTATGGSVNSVGLYTPSKTGTFDVTATYQTFTSKATVTVTPGATAIVSVTPGAATISVGQKQQFASTTQDAKGNPTQDTVQWTVSGGGTVDSTGLFAATAEGNWEVIGAVGAAKGSAFVTVEKAKTVSIAVTPKSSTIAAGDTVQLSAALLDAGGNPTGDVATWSASSGTVDQTGKFGSTKTGTFTVTASFSTLSDSATVTVLPGAPRKAVISPANATTEEGRTQTFAVTAEDAHGNEILITTVDVAWSADASIGTIDDKGVFSAKKAGTGKVTVEVSTPEGKATASAAVTVKAKPGGGGGGGGGGGAGGAFDFIASPTGMLALAAIVGAVIAVAALMMLRNRRKSQARAAAEAWSGRYQQSSDQWGGPGYQGFQGDPGRQGGPEWRP